MPEGTGVCYRKVNDPAAILAASAQTPALNQPQAYLILRHLPPHAGDTVMPKLTILVPAAIAAALLSATVFASSPGTDSTGLVAKAPNRAEVFAAQH
jgi:hypothetical protein